eukprot:1158433-Pelagomonas_calceolata.AAC.16
MAVISGGIQLLVPSHDQWPCPGAYQRRQGAEGRSAGKSSMRERLMDRPLSHVGWHRQKDRMLVRQDALNDLSHVQTFYSSTLTDTPAHEEESPVGRILWRIVGYSLVSLVHRYTVVNK